MRPIIWFCVAMAASLGALLFEISIKSLLLWGITGAAVFIGFFIKSGKSRGRILIVSVLLGFVTAGAVYAFHWGGYRQTAALCDEKTYDITATVMQVTEQQGGFCQYLLKTRTIGQAGENKEKTLKVLVKSSVPLGIDLFDQVSIKGQFKLFERAKAPGQFDEQTYYKSSGIYLYLSGDKILLSKKGKAVLPFWERLPYRIREGVKAASAYLSGDNGPLMVSLLTGDKTELSPAVKDDFSKSGLSHVIAVSGMHISLLIGAAGTVIALLGGPPLLRGLISLVLILLYMAVGGFSPSIMRAGLVYLVAFGGDVLKRDYDKYTALAASAVVIMALNPFVLYQAAFWLSYLSALGILLSSPAVRRGIGKINLSSAVLRHGVYYIASLAANTISATVFTIPVLLLVFGRFSVLGPLANILVLPLVPLAFVGSVLTAAVFPVCSPAARALAWLIDPLFSWITRVADYTARLGDILATFDKTYLLGFLIYLIGTFVLLWILGKKEELKKNVRSGLCCIGAVGLCLTLLAFIFGSKAPYDQPFPDDALMKVTFLDVGQGSASFVRTHAVTLLIDCGTTSPDKDAAGVVTEHMIKCGQSRIDYAALTHFHTDHAGGLLQILQKCRVINLILPDLEDPSGIKENLLKYAAENQINILLIGQDEELTLADGMTLQMLVFGEGNGGDNEDGIVYRLGAGGRHVLFTGDIEEENQIRLAKRADLASDIYTVPHHGSGNAASVSFLEEAGAAVGVISVGQNNPYGHPDGEVLKKLEKAEIKVYRTDRNQTVDMVLYKDRISVAAENEGEPP